MLSQCTAVDRSGRDRCVPEMPARHRPATLHEGHSMPTTPELRIRRSLQELQDDYANGNKKPLEDLMRAWKGIKELPPDDPTIILRARRLSRRAVPRRGLGQRRRIGAATAITATSCSRPGTASTCCKLEEALRSIPGCDDVMLPYWDETQRRLAEERHSVGADAEEISCSTARRSRTRCARSSSTGTSRINISSDDPDYSKPKGYETVRYPLSGLVGAQPISRRPTAHNAQYPGLRHERQAPERRTSSPG